MKNEPANTLSFAHAIVSLHKLTGDLFGAQNGALIFVFQ